MNAIAEAVPELFGGAADLTASTKTIFKPGANFHVDPAGRNVFFGVREFAHVRGGEWHGGARRADALRIDLLYLLRLLQAGAAHCRADAGRTRCSCLRTTRSALGEDGPTHQPIEHLMALRAVPHLTDFRPADANETAACWRLALERKGPASSR